MSFRLRPKFTGLFHDEVVTDSFWIREEGRLSLPSLTGVESLTVVGEVLPATAGERASRGDLGLQVRLDAALTADHPTLPEGPFRITFPLANTQPKPGHELALKLHGVGTSNLLAWLGRVTGLGFLQPWRRQPRNHRLRI